MRPVGLSVDSFLAEAASSGAFDSEGVFTIAGEAAIGKLGSFQLPRKSAWVLKVVQCAVAWGGQAIEVKQTAEATFMGFAGEREFDVAGLEKALLDLDHAGDVYLEHLACGLRAVGFGDKRAFSVRVHYGETLDCYRWDGKELFRERSSIPKVSGCTVHLKVNFPDEDRGRWLGGLFRSAGRASDEYKELVDRAEACPIALTVDGRRIDTLTTPSRKTEGCTVAELCLAWKAPPTGAEATLSLPLAIELKGSKMPFSDSFIDKGPMLVEGDLERRGTEAIVKIGYYYKIISHRGKHSPFRFEPRPQFWYQHWVVDGVVCQSTRFSSEILPVALDVYLPGHDLPKDLSGLSFRQEAKAIQERRLKSALKTIAPTMETLRILLESHRAIPFTEHTYLYGGFGAFLGLVVPGIGKLVGAGVMGISLAQSASDKGSILQDCKSNLGRAERWVLAAAHGREA